MSSRVTQPANTHRRVEVTNDQLPLSCPMPEDAIWNSHPKVFIPIEQYGHAKCPYCGTEYVLKDWDPLHAHH